MVGLRQEQINLGVQGAHRCAELGDGLPVAGHRQSLAGDGGDRQRVKENLPKLQVIGQVQRRRQPQRGAFGARPGLRERKSPFALLEQAETGPVAVHPRWGVVIPAAQEPAGHPLPVDIGHRDLAVIGAQGADLHRVGMVLRQRSRPLKRVARFPASASTSAAPIAPVKWQKRETWMGLPSRCSKAATSAVFLAVAP